MNLQDLTNRAIEIRRLFSEKEIKKVGKEWKTEQLAQGLVVDLGNLIKLVMAKEGFRTIEDVDAKLKHELSDCLWSILLIAHSYNIDLETAYKSTMDDLERYLTNKLAE